MSDMLLDFTVTYVRNTAAIPAMWSADMDYLRSRVSTTRSVTSDRLTMEDNRLYEGAKTLVDLLDYTRLTTANFVLNEVHIEISDNIDFPHALLQATIRTTAFDGVYGPITLTFIYTNVGQRTTFGGYIITVKAATGSTLPFISGIGNMTVADRFGTNIKELNKYVADDAPYCYKAGQILRYSENFPTPSEFINDMDICLQDATAALIHAER